MVAELSGASSVCSDSTSPILKSNNLKADHVTAITEEMSRLTPDEQRRMANNVPSLWSIEERMKGSAFLTFG